MNDTAPTPDDCLRALEAWPISRPEQEHKPGELQSDSDPGASPQRADELQKQSLSTFFQHWRDSLPGASETQAVRQSLTLIHGLAACGLAPDDEGKVLNELLTFVDAEHRSAAVRLLNPRPLANTTRREALRQAIFQVTELVPAIAKTALAAMLFRRDGIGDRAEAAERLGQAAAHYDRAWPLSDEPWPAETPDHFASRTDGAPACWRELARADSFATGWQSGWMSDDGDDVLSRTVPERPSITTVLMLQRLLAVLFGETESTSSAVELPGYFCNDLSMLTARDDGQGEIVASRVESVHGPRAGFYPDPLTFGVTILDDAMLKSLRLAWRCCETSLPALSGSSEQPARPQVRLSVNLPWTVPVLGGGSAGGLLACGLYATACRKRLDHRRTASCALRLKPDASTTGDLKPEDVQVTRIGSLPAKWEALRERGLKWLILQTAQAGKWKGRHDTAFVMVAGAGNLAELFELLVGDARYEETLEDHARRVGGTWNRLANAATVSMADATDATESDRRDNETFRFDCYVQPNYRLERPPVQSERQALHDGLTEETIGFRNDRNEGSTEDDRAASVAGDGDERIRQVLRLMFRPDLDSYWPDAPEWLVTAQQKQKHGTRWICAYDNAGIGKTVFTYRVAHVLTQPEAMREFFGGFAPLVVRVEGRWKSQHSRFVSLREFLLLEVLDQLSPQQRSEPGIRSKVQAVVEYALDQKRVVIILDGFDQFDTADREHVVDLLSSKGPQRDRSDYELAVNNCHWIIAGRVHVIDEQLRNGRLFLDSHWARLRIDPFTPRQQSEYFRKPDGQPASNGRDLSREWLRLIGITDATDGDTRSAIRERMDHLLRLPMTLWYMRSLLENTPPGQTLPVFRTLAELSVVTGYRMLDRAYDTTRNRVTQMLAAKSNAHLREPYLGDDDQRLKQLSLLDHVLSLIAFQLMLEENYNGIVAGDELADFEKRCEERWLTRFQERSSLLAGQIARLKRRVDKCDIELGDLDDELDADDLSDQKRHAAEQRQTELQKKRSELDQQQRRLKVDQSKVATEEESALPHWQWAVAVLKTIELEHRSVTEMYSSAGLAFRSRKIVEARAARYLTKYATVRDVRGNGERETNFDDLRSRCAWDFTNRHMWTDSDAWLDCWMLAIEMPRHSGWHRITTDTDAKKALFDDTHLNEAVTCNSLSVLFEQPKHEIRPNELIYHAWPLFEYDEQILRGRLFLTADSDELCFGDDLSPDELQKEGERLILTGADDVLKIFRASSRDLVTEIEHNTLSQRERAREIGHDNWLKEWQTASCHIKSRTLVQCPPQSMKDEFHSGKRDADPRINTIGNLIAHRVRVRSFEALATPVNRGIYDLFDMAFRKSEVTSSPSLFTRIAKYNEAYASPPEGSVGERADTLLYPVLMADWFDAWVFSRWLGSEFRLPSNCQWEFACRGGTTTNYHFGKSLNGIQANCNGNCPYGTKEKGPYVARTTIGGDSRYELNPYGLFDLHGNVREWCRDRFYQYWMSDLSNQNLAGVFEQDEGPRVGSLRALRGGSWFTAAEHCRSAYYTYFAPVYRWSDIGFRVVRVSGFSWSPEPSASSS